MAKVTATGSSPGLLRGWAAIARHCGWSERSVQRYLRSGFPAFQWGRDVVSDPELIRRWLMDRERQRAARRPV